MCEIWDLMLHCQARKQLRQFYENWATFPRWKKSKKMALTTLFSSQIATLGGWCLSSVAPRTNRQSLHCYQLNQWQMKKSDWTILSVIDVLFNHISSLFSKKPPLPGCFSDENMKYTQQILQNIPSVRLSPQQKKPFLLSVWIPFFKKGNGPVTSWTIIYIKPLPRGLMGARKDSLIYISYAFQCGRCPCIAPLGFAW